MLNHDDFKSIDLGYITVYIDCEKQDMELFFR